MAVKLIDELQKEIKAAGEAVTQEAYEKAYDHTFQNLDNLEKLLNDNRYLEGNEIENPYQIVGLGPDESYWNEPNNRAEKFA